MHPANLPRAGFRRRGAFIFLFFLFIPFDSLWLSGGLKDPGLGQAASLGGQSARPKSLRKSLRIWPGRPLAGLLPRRGGFRFSFISYFPLSIPFGFLGTPRPRRPSRLLARRGAFLFPSFPISPFDSFYFLQIPTNSYNFLSTFGVRICKGGGLSLVA